MERSKITYEWDVEQYNCQGDIVNHHHSNKCPTRDLEEFERLVLVRDYGNEWDGTLDRSWAYVTHNELPKFFDSGTGCITSYKVPRRFQKELNAVLEEAKS